jgi:hypothetical protein
VERGAPNCFFIAARKDSGINGARPDDKIASSSASLSLAAVALPRRTKKRPDDQPKLYTQLTASSSRSEMGAAARHRNKAMAITTAAPLWQRCVVGSNNSGQHGS